MVNKTNNKSKEDDFEANASEVDADLKAIEALLRAGFRTPGSALDTLAKAVETPRKATRRKQTDKKSILVG